MHTLPDHSQSRVLHGTSTLEYPESFRIFLSVYLMPLTPRHELAFYSSWLWRHFGPHTCTAENNETYVITSHLSLDFRWVKNYNAETKLQHKLNQHHWNMDSRYMYIVHTTTGIHREAWWDTQKCGVLVTSYCDLAASALSTTIGGALWVLANFSRFLREPWTLCGIDDLVAFSSSRLCLYV